MDGAYVNGHVRPANKKADRVDRRLAENQNPDKRCVFAMRLRDNDGPGAKRTLTFVMKQENQADVKKLAGRFVKKGAAEGGAEEGMSVLDMDAACVQSVLQGCRFSFRDSAEQDVRTKPVGIWGPSVFFV